MVAETRYTYVRRVCEAPEQIIAIRRKDILFDNFGWERYKESPAERLPWIFWFKKEPQKR